MLYLCHDFYKGLANVYINTAMLARFGAPAARRLWDTIKTEGLKKDGVGKIQSRLETETEKLNREVKEAIAKGTAKVTEIDLKQIDFTKYEPSKIDFDLRKIGLSQMVLMARSNYMGPAPAPEISRANQENLKHGYYVLSEEEKKTLNENNNDISSVYKTLEKAGHEFLPDLRKKAGLEENRRNASSNHEENRLFLPTKKAKEEIKKFCGEDIRIFNNLFPAFSGNISENIIFCALHRSYKLGKAASALGSRMRGMLTNILEQIRNRAYAPNPWDEVLGNPAFAEWPLKEYGQRLKAYRESLQNIKQPETSWGQRAWQALGNFFYQYNEENRKVAEAERGEMLFKPNTQNTPALKPHTGSKVRYWKLKDSSVKIAGLENKLDTLFSLFVKYLGKEVEPRYFTVTDGSRPVDEQLYYILLARKKGQTTYSGFRNHTNNKKLIDAISTNTNIGSSAKEAASNSVIQELKTNLIDKWETEDDLKTAMVGMGMYHLVEGATDVSIKDDLKYAERLDESAFKNQPEIQEIVKSIDIHFIGDEDTEHVHIIFR